MIVVSGFSVWSDSDRKCDRESENMEDSDIIIIILWSVLTFRLLLNVVLLLNIQPLNGSKPLSIKLAPNIICVFYKLQLKPAYRLYILLYATLSFLILECQPRNIFCF